MQDKSKTIAGLVDGLVGLKAGGKRKILIPPEAGYASEAGAFLEVEPRMPTFATRRQLANHQSEPLLFEVQLVRVIE
jgi:FKBP-type peptidyl-prolyl cis-trans isomerase 2